MLKPIYSHGCDEKSHPGHLPLLSSRQDWKFARFQHVMNEASSKRLNMSGLHVSTQCPLSTTLSSKTPPYSARRGLPRQSS